MRGTAQIPTRQKDGTISLTDHPEWRQHFNLRWDINPWSGNGRKYKMQQRYQARVAFLDSPEVVGGFRALPGSHHSYIDEWAEKHDMPSNFSMSSYRSIKIAADDPAEQHYQKIPVKAGHMVVFDSRLLHGTFPNESSSMRLVLYERKMPTYMHSGDLFSAENVLRRHSYWKEVQESYRLDEKSKTLLALE